MKQLRLMFRCVFIIVCLCIPSLSTAQINTALELNIEKLFCGTRYGNFSTYGGEPGCHTGNDYCGTLNTVDKSLSFGRVKLRYGMPVTPGCPCTNKTDHGMGRIIEIQYLLTNGEQIYASYNHLNGFHSLAIEDAFVAKNQVVAYMGQSGSESDKCYDDIHTHFEIKTEAGIGSPMLGGYSNCIREGWGYIRCKVYSQYDCNAHGSPELFGYKNPDDYINQTNILIPYLSTNENPTIMNYDVYGIANQTIFGQLPAEGDFYHSAIVARNSFNRYDIQNTDLSATPVFLAEAGEWNSNTLRNVNGLTGATDDYEEGDYLFIATLYDNGFDLNDDAFCDDDECRDDLGRCRKYGYPIKFTFVAGDEDIIIDNDQLDNGYKESKEPLDAETNEVPGYFASAKMVKGQSGKSVVWKPNRNNGTYRVYVHIPNGADTSNLVYTLKDDKNDQDRILVKPSVNVREEWILLKGIKDPKRHDDDYFEIEEFEFNPQTYAGLWLGDDPEIPFANANISADEWVAFDAIKFVQGIGEALDNTDLTWKTSETLPDNDAEWFRQKQEYISSDEDGAQSGTIEDGQTSYFETVVTGPDTLSFYWKVSSEQQRDFLTFYIDNQEQNSISGEVDWQEKEYAIPEGTHTLKWAYSKDSQNQAGDDAAWVDAVTLENNNPPTLVGRVSGFVQDENGAPVSDATVELYESGSSAPSGKVAATDLNGQFEITGIQTSGNYFVKVSKDGFETYTGDNEPFTVSIGQLTSGLSITLNSGSVSSGSIMGVVRDDNGNELAGATVELFGPNELISSGKMVTTGANGQFMLNGIETSGDYFVVVSKDGFETYYGDNDPIMASFGQIASAPSIMLNPVGSAGPSSIAGIVQDDDGNLLSGASVELFVANSSIPANKSAATDTNGQFKIDEIETEGDYFIVASKDGFETYLGYENPINVIAGSNITGINVTLNAVNPSDTGGVRGVVKDAGGNLIAGATVDLYGPNASVPTNKTALTDSNGEFVIDNIETAGEYFVVVNQDGYKIYIGDNNRFYVPAGQTYDVLPVILTPIGVAKVTGRVVNQEGVAVEGAKIELINFEPLFNELIMTATTDRNGNFSFDQIEVEGQYYLSANKQGYAFYNHPVFAVTLGTETDIDITLSTGDNVQCLRSADPYDKWKDWQVGTNRVVTAELRDGKASHSLSPAELIYFSAKENQINPVLLLSKLQDEQSLLAQGVNEEATNGGDFEWRLLRATGLGCYDSSDIPTYYGFYPQLVGATYQYHKFRTVNGYDFKTAYETYTTGENRYDFFIKNIYPVYAEKMNNIAGLSYDTHPDSNGYYSDFQDVTAANIQEFLEDCDGALKNTELFREPPVSDSVRYCSDFEVPLTQDADDDGMPDEWENSYFGNLDHNGTEDSDNDGLSNLDEYGIGSNPALADTDTDGLPDGWEIEHGTNPLFDDANGDIDNDGITNRDEYNLGPVFIATRGMRKNGNLTIVSLRADSPSGSMGDDGVVKFDGTVVPSDWTTQGIIINGLYNALGINWYTFVKPLHVEVYNTTGAKIADTYYPFTDVELSEWYTRPIMKMWREQVLSGYEDTQSNAFKPDQAANRVQYIKSAVVADEIANDPDRTYLPFNGEFDDVPANEWYAPYVKYAKDNGIVEGCTPDSFCPADPMTRAAATKVTTLTFDQYVPLVEAYQNGKTPIRPFADVNDPSAWYYPYVHAAAEGGLVHGYRDGYFRPGDNVTRAEMAKINCIAAFGVSACMFDGEFNLPYVDEVTPLVATLNQPEIFTVRGRYLPDSTAFFIEECEDMVSLGGDAHERRFRCIPSYTEGPKRGVVKDQPGGLTLSEFIVMVESPVSQPAVGSLTPLTATLDTPTIFTVTGENLTNTTAFFIEECADMVSLGGNAFERKFQCTPSYTTGAKECIINDQTGGDVIGTFTVQVNAAGTPSDPAVSSMTPLSATLDVLTTFTVKGTNLPDTTALYIAECEDMVSLGGSASERQFRCTPSYTTGAKECIIKDQTGGDVIGSFTVQVNAAGAPSDPAVNSMTPLTAMLDELTTFTVRGENLTSTTAFYIEDCVDVVSLGGDAQERRFSCMPSYTTGAKECIIKDQTDGKVLKTYTVTFEDESPVVTGVSPFTVTLDEPVIFTVYGENLPETTAFYVDECANMQALGGTATERKFQCTPSYKAALQSGLVKDREDGNVLYNFSVNVEWGQPKVDSVWPLSANLNEPTVFIVKGKNLTNDTAFFIHECENVNSYGGVSEELTFMCTPTYSTGDKWGVIKDKAGSDGVVLKNFNITVY